MIFVTVGTHEQQFDRLVREVDNLKASGVITEDVIIQTGYCTYEAEHCRWCDFFPYDQMVKYIEEARVVITHGGPSSFIMPLQIRKVPIVVPRQKQFDEHINNHQLDFCRAVVQRQKSILLVEDIRKLGGVIQTYESVVAGMPSAMRSNNEAFCVALATEITALF